MTVEVEETTERRGRHLPVVSILMGPRKTAMVDFYCPCGVRYRTTICDVNAHPPLRYTAALRSLHDQGVWPPTDADLDDAEASGWGAPSTESVAAELGLTLPEWMSL